MKLSNKILIGFFGFIFLYLTAVFAEVRLRGTHTLLQGSKGLTETVDLEGMAYLILPELDHPIYIIGSDNPRMEVKSTTGDLLRKLKYSLSSDTLSLEQLEVEEDVPVNITIYVPKKSFRGVTLNGAVAIIKDLEQERFIISLNEGRIEMTENNKVVDIQLNAHNSYFYLSGNTNVFETVSVAIDNSKVIVDTQIKLLKGTMENNSYLGLSGAAEIQFKKDVTSNLNLY